MHPLIADNLDAIRTLARKYGVARLEVFGSVTTGAFDSERSDIDFLVTYPDHYDYGPWLSRYQELSERLEELLDRKVDLVMTGGFRNPYFIRAVEESRRLLYAA